jgi:hypothetical protein
VSCLLKMCWDVISSSRGLSWGGGNSRSLRFLFTGLLTALVLIVHGYHPLADDGAVYVAGIKKLADPSLYQSDAVFASSPTHLSIFAHVLATMLLRGHLPLPFLLLLCHLASIFLFLLGSWALAARIFVTNRSRWGAVLLATCCFTLPVAGTSLCIMDPYVTARSFSTPLGLFALAAVLDEQWIESLIWLALAALLHPLMAAYTALAMLTLVLAARRRWWSLGLFCGLGCLLCAVIFIDTRQVDPTQAYNRAALSRSYFFLSSWRWFEYPGLLLPLLLLGTACFRRQVPWPARALAIAATFMGSCALFASLCFVHRSGSLLLARLQILRAFQFVYIAGVLLGGGLLTRLPKRAIAVVLLLIAGALFAGQRLTYPESSHVEWPWIAPRNEWQEAFLWIRAHTPKDAIFALDNDYIESPGEDAQGFRASAERSAVADWFKDGGIASNFPQAANPWWEGSQATAKLNQANDEQRLTRLHPLAVTWVVLPAQASTGFACPFTNDRVRVCRLSPLLHPTDSAK